MVSPALNLSAGKLSKCTWHGPGSDWEGKISSHKLGPPSLSLSISLCLLSLAVRWKGRSASSDDAQHVTAAGMWHRDTSARVYVWPAAVCTTWVWREATRRPRAGQCEPPACYCYYWLCFLILTSHLWHAMVCEGVCVHVIFRVLFPLCIRTHCQEDRSETGMVLWNKYMSYVTLTYLHYNPCMIVIISHSSKHVCMW